MERGDWKGGEEEDIASCVISHSSYLWWWVHEVELEEVLHSKGLEQKHNVGQVGTLDLWHCGLQHLAPVGPLRVQTVTLPEGDKRTANQEGEGHWVWTVTNTQEKG